MNNYNVMICLDDQGPYKVLFNKKVVYRTRRRNVLKLDFRKCPVQKKSFSRKSELFIDFLYPKSRRLLS